MKAEYEPRDEVLILKEPSGGAWLYVFGALREVVGIRAKKAKARVSAFMKTALRSAIKTHRVELRDGKILHLDTKGRVVRSFSSPEEQMYFNRVERESHDVLDTLDQMRNAQRRRRPEK
jgi:hypothetical protein